MNTDLPSLLPMILARVPLWVPALLISLIIVGLLLRREREARPAVLLLVSLAMSAYSLASVMLAFAGHGLALLAWMAGTLIAIGLAFGPLAPRGLRAVAAGRRVHMPASWTPMALILGIFGVRFALGLAAGLGMPVTAASPWAGVAACMLGIFGGGFVARALVAWRVARRFARPAIVLAA
ncbi:MAG: DUF6622 family protein [Burkholderiaceae bacterium]